MITKNAMMFYMDFVEIPEISKTYDNAVKELLNGVRNLSNINEIRLLFLNFINSFTMIPELWILWLRLESENDNNKNDEVESYYEREIYLLGEKHFTFNNFVVVNNRVLKIVTDEKIRYWFYRQHSVSPLSKRALQILSKALCYPNDNMFHLYMDYEQVSAEPLKKSLYLKSSAAYNFYNKTKDIENDIEKWFKALIETDDDNFIIDTIEYRLSIKPNLTQLWKLYIKYLTELNDIKCLDVYSRYCRLFIEDLETVINYKKEIEKYSERSKNVSKWWFDITEFEREFFHLLNAPNITVNDLELQIENFAECFEKLKKEKLEKFNFLEMKESEAKKAIKIKELLPLTTDQKQCFSFPSPLILYILDNSAMEIRHQLYETCKYFFYKNNQKPICHYFYVSEFRRTSNKVPIFTSQSVYTTADSFQNHTNFFNNYIISHFFAVLPRQNSYRNIASQILEKVESNVKYLLLFNQDLTLKELQLLKSKKLFSARFKNVIISDYRELSSVKIVETFLYVTVIELCNYSISLNEVTEITKLEIINKMRVLKFNEITEYFNPELLLNFIKEICLPKSKVEIHFSTDIPENLRNILTTAFNEESLNFE